MTPTRVSEKNFEGHLLLKKPRQEGREEAVWDVEPRLICAGSLQARREIRWKNLGRRIRGVHRTGGNHKEEKVQWGEGDIQGVKKK